MNDFLRFPETWLSIRLGALIHQTKRPVRRDPNATYWPLGVRSYGRGIFEKDSLRGADLGDSDFFWAEPGELVLSGPFAWEGAVAIVQEGHKGSVFTHRFPTFQPNPGVDAGFLLQFFKTPLGVFLLQENSNGAAGRNRPLNVGTLLKERVPLPPLPTQKAIADFLDTKTAAIDKLIEKKQKLLTLLAEKRAALINQAVTKGLDPNVPMKDSGGGVGVTVAGKQYPEVRLRFLGALKGGAGFPHAEQGATSGSLPFYKVKDLSDADATGYLHETDNYVELDTARRLGAYVFPRNTVFMAKVGAALLLHRFARASLPSCIDNNMLGLVPRGEAIYSDFLAYAIKTVRFNDVVNPGAVPSLGAETISNKTVPVPPLQTQKAIADFLDTKTAVIDASKIKIREQIEKLQEYRQALITAAVTGQLEIGE